MVNSRILHLNIGNRDGHAKNLSLIYQEDSAAPSLALFYDLVSIEFLNDLGNSSWGRRLAFRIGRDDIHERVGQKKVVATLVLIRYGRVS
ncbi:MAG: HipA domain-containing protein [Gammaproteobacteria bacterium]|nr:HipA domain-containing protein [Gammaproteobacteria bacterium]